MSQWSHYHHITAFSEFLAYKTRVPVRGAILLNEDMDEVVLVKGWKKGANWSFPRGKINKDEKDLDCAIREVYEETGYDVGEAGLVKDEKDVKFIEITMREQHMRLYVFRGVPRQAYFEPRTRKEISKIEWYKLSELPTLKRSKQQDQGFAVANANKFYMVAPFMHPLKKWIAHQKRVDAKTQPGSKQSMEAMDEASQIAKTITPMQAPVELAPPSELPEVADASAHLKRLLNINNAAPAQSPVQPPAAASGDKSNALLQLLRSGSSSETPNDEPAVPSQPFMAPNPLPGLSPRTQYAEQPGSLPQTLPPPFPGMLPPYLQQSAIADQALPQRLDHLFPPTTHVGSSNGFPPFPDQQPPIQPYREDLLPPSLHNIPPPERPAVAPFQQTGDPQFSHPGQPPQIQGAAVPPASKLPPPKLTSHSLALLSVFKEEAPKTPKTSSATVSPSTAQDTGLERKPQRHQDQLLNLLRGSPAPATFAPVPAELAADSTPPTRKQALQRSQNDTPKQRHSGTPRGPRSAAQTSATVSGPLKMPQFEGIARPPPKKMQNVSNRKVSKDRQQQQQAQAPSPITILPRPQSAKKDWSPTPPMKAQGLRRSSQSRTGKAKPAEPPKPFQPQILRRPEKAEMDSNLPSRPKDAGESGPQNVDSLLQPARETGSPDDISSRPSQTATQKEALLSLFGKKSEASGSPLTGPLDIQTSVPKPSSSSVISPLSPPAAPSALSGGGTVPGSGTPAENDMQASGSGRISSPDNKAFLLGFLEGVAKGNK